MIKKIIIYILFSAACLLAKTNDMVKYHVIGHGKPVIMFIGGIHGDEISGTMIVDAMRNTVPKKGSLILIPRANEIAVKDKVRTEYYMSDLNRTFYRNGKDRSFAISKEIIKIIKETRPDMIIDFHESPFDYDENKERNTHMGNTIIFSPRMQDKYNDLMLELIDIGYTPIESEIPGSISREIPDKLGIFVLTVEISQEYDINTRIKKLNTFIDVIKKYFGI